ncbi:MAG: HDIG domain-containing protein [Spirochaetales bacterium]|nr:HDIG domain-containing protein [Spirochaetales bacterium]
MSAKLPVSRYLAFLFTSKGFQKWSFILFIIVFIVAYIIVLISSQLSVPVFGTAASDYVIDEPAPADFIVQRDIHYPNLAATENRKAAKAAQVLPVFVLNNDIRGQVLNRFTIFKETLQSAVRNKITINSILNEIHVVLPELTNIITKNEITVFRDFSEDSRQFTLSRIEELLNLAMASGIIQNLEGFIQNNPDLSSEGKLELIAGNNSETIILDKALSLARIADWTSNSIKATALVEVGKSLIIFMVQAFARENCFFDERRTQDKVQKAMDSVQLVTERLYSGTVIVKKGDIVTQDDLDKIRAHGFSDVALNLNNIFSSLLIVIFIFSMSLLLLSYQVTNTRIKKNQSIMLIAIGLLYLLLIAILHNIDFKQEWLNIAIFLPTALMSILVTLLISQTTGIIYSFLLSLMLLLVTRFDAVAFIFALFTGISASAIANRAKKRIDLVISGLLLSIIGSIVILLLGFQQNWPMNHWYFAFIFGSANGFICGAFSIWLLPLLEHILNAPTRFRLLELSDLNSPVFKKMLTVAPGTYNHSLIMANLAESTCLELGANALLARVGAYYHDIGKIDQPDYFIENQKKENKHDELKPSLSVAVIKSHVKMGIEKAKELGLPNEVIDIIAQHHGKGIITYFYHRALLNEKKDKISSEDFRYSGERPKTKEAAVVMLADVSEAASRSMKRPTVSKLEKLVWKIIIDKFDSGELSECNLTLNDLELIKQNFVKLLAGHFHSRIEYPKVKDNG